MGAIREAVSRVVGWPVAKVRRVAEQVSERLEATREAERARLARARAENATKVIEVSPPSSRAGGGPAQEPPKPRE